MSDPIEEIRQREQAATAGPWGWRGHINGSVALITLHSGGRTVIDTQRADPCIVTIGGPSVWDTELVLTWEACGTCRKAFADRDLDERIKCEKAENTPTVWVQSERGGAVPLNQYAKAEVAQWSKEIYRDDVKDTTHPDAEFIAHAREDVPVLLGAVDRVRALHTVETILTMQPGCGDDDDTCGHDGDCPQDNPVRVCRGCRTQMEEDYFYILERPGALEQIEWKCPTIQALDEPAVRTVELPAEDVTV